MKAWLLQNKKKLATKLEEATLMRRILKEMLVSQKEKADKVQVICPLLFLPPTRWEKNRKRMI